MRVTNGVPRGSPPALTIAIMNYAETLKAAPTPTKLWIKKKSSTGTGDSDGDSAISAANGNVELLLQSTFADLLHENYGAPTTVWTRYEIEHDMPGKSRGETFRL
jgi:hypothetical protein